MRTVFLSNVLSLMVIVVAWPLVSTATAPPVSAAQPSGESVDGPLTRSIESLGISGLGIRAKRMTKALSPPFCSQSIERAAHLRFWIRLLQFFDTTTPSRAPMEPHKVAQAHAPLAYKILESTHLPSWS